MISVLYIDDERPLLDIAKRYLERTGNFTVDTAESAQIAREMIHKTCYDAIVSDYQMPGMDGIEFLKVLRNSGNTTPFIIFTGKGREEVVIQAFESGADFYVQKGGDPRPQFAELERKITRAVELYRAENERGESELRLRAAYEQLAASEEELKSQFDALAQSESLIRESEARFRELADLLPQIVFEMDLDFRMTYANQYARKFIGVTEENLDKGMSALQFIVPEHHDRIRWNIEKVLRGETADDYDYTAVCVDGTTFPVLVYSAPILHSGHPSGIRGIMVDITHRKTVENALRESESKYRNIIEHMQDVVYRTDRDGKLIMFSPYGVKLAGYSSEEEMIGLDVAQDTYKNPEERKRFLARMAEKGYVENYPLVLKTKNGTLRYVTTSSHFYYDDWGNVLGVEGILHDITDQKRAEESFLESELRFRSLFERSEEPQLILDGNGYICECNDASLALFALSDQDLVKGHLPSELAPPVQPDGTLSSVRGREILRKVLQDGSARFEWAHQKQDEDHTQILTELLFTLLPLAGQPTIHVAIRDITDRKQAEEALRESEEMYRSLAESTHDLIYVIDRNDLVRYVNTSAARLYGIPVHEMIGKPRNQFFSPEISANQEQGLRKVFLSGEPVHSSGPLEFGSKTLWFDHHLTPVHDKKGKIIEVLGISRDISDLKRVEEALRTANRQLNLLNSITRHDILNKITVLRAYLDLLKEPHTEAEMELYLRVMESEILAVKSQIDFTRTYQDLGTQEPQWQLLDSILPREQVPAGIRLIADLDDIEVFADPMLKKVFENLLDNASRHGERVTTIRIFGQESGKDLVCVWENDGIGIPAREKEKIFERGYGKNTGLGLFLAREILAITGLTIKETGSGETGVRFEIMIPEGMYRYKTSTENI